MKREADMDDAPDRLPTVSVTQTRKSRKRARGKITREVKEERLEAQACKIKPDPDATAVYEPVPIHIKKEQKVDVKQESQGSAERPHCSSADQSVAGGRQSSSEECDSEGEQSSSAESSSEESDSEGGQSSSDEESQSEDVVADAAPASPEEVAMSEGCAADVKEASGEESDNGGSQTSSGEDSDSESEASSSDEESEIKDVAADAAPASHEEEAMSEDRDVKEASGEESDNGGSQTSSGEDSDSESEASSSDEESESEDVAADAAPASHEEEAMSEGCEGDVKASSGEESENGGSQSSSGEDSDSEGEQSSSDEDSDREGHAAAAAQPVVDNQSSSGGSSSSDETSSSDEDSDSEAAQSTAEEACATARHPASSKEDTAAASFLNPEQQTAFRAILNVLQRPRSRHRVCMCVVGASGTGKSHLLRCVLAAAAAEGATCLASAFSAKAAHALGGQTVHSLFGLREWGGVTSAAFPPRDSLMRIRSADVIAVDDAMMLQAAQVDAIVDILDSTRFDGVLLFSINPGAVLPVHVGGSLSDRIDRSIHSAKSWPCFRSRHKQMLTKHMRIHDAALADFVHDLSVGAATAVSELSSREGCEQQVMLSRRVFTPVFDAVSAQQWVLQGSQPQPWGGGGGGGHGMIICTTNAQVDEHHTDILQRYPGHLQQYPSLHRRPRDFCDSGSCDAARVFTPESSITRQPKNANMEDRLCLKVGVPVRVTCKVCPEVGLYTDARATVVALEGDVVAVRLMNEETGQLREGVLKLGRADFEGVHQFPLKLAWAVTAHRAAAFTPERVVADLRRACWAHGQLAVMLSRVRQSSKLRVLANSGEGQLDGVAARNVVIKEVVAGCVE